MLGGVLAALNTDLGKFGKSRGSLCVVTDPVEWLWKHSLGTDVVLPDQLQC